MITGLGHIGIFVRDLGKMVAFYRDPLGLQVTKRNWRAGAVFLSADPQAAETILAEVDELWQRVGDIGVGERMPEEPPTLQF